MAEKRYAIVRVDKDYYLNSCPAGFENINNDFVCSYRKDKVLNQYVHNCKKCRYGDTKEQLIRKILQVMMRKYTISYLRTTRQDKINPKHFKSAIDYYLEIAKEIVEFLGVE